MAPAKTKIAFVEARYHSFYGAQRSMYTLVTHLPRDVIASVVLVPGEGIVAERFREAGIDVEVLPLSGKANSFGGEVLRLSLWARAAVAAEIARYNLRVAKWLRRERIQMVYVNDLRALLYVGIAAKTAGLPLLWYVRSDGKPSILSNVGLRLADRVILIAEGVRGIFGDAAYDAYRDKFTTLYTGFPFREDNSDRSKRQEIRSRFGFPPDAKVIGIVASVTRRKGHDVLIEAVAKLRAMQEDVRLIIVGDIPPGYEDYGHQLRMRVEELGLSPYVRWAEYQRDVGAFYSAMDVLALPSRGEGLPRTVVEALGMGLPVVATDVGGVKEILTTEVLGRVVPVDDIDALAAALKEVVTRPEMVTEGAVSWRQEYVKAKFSLVAYINGFLSIVEDAARQKNRRELKGHFSIS